MRKVLLAALFLILPVTAQASWPAPIQPTIDCSAEQLTGSGQCGGTLAPTFTKFGAPTLVDSPYFTPGGAKGAVQFNGTTDYFDGGDVGDQPGSFTICAAFKTNSIAAGTFPLVAKDGVQRSFYLARSGNGVMLAVLKAGGTGSSIYGAGSGAGLVVGQESIACGAYEWTGVDGSARLRLYAVGALTPEVSNAAGPAFDSTAALRIGTNGPAVAFHSGDISRIALWSGWAASNADLARLEASMRQPPLGITHTRNQSQSIVSADGTKVYTVPPNVGAVGPNGLQVYGQRISRVLNNQRVSTATSTGGMLLWGKRGTASVAPGCVIAPDGSCTADEITVGNITTDDIYYGPTGYTASAPLATALWLKRVSTSGTLRIVNPQGGPTGSWAVDLATLGTGWTRVMPGHPALTVTLPFSAAANGAAGIHIWTTPGTLTVQIWRPWQVEGAIAGPDAEVGAGAYTALADSVKHGSTVTSGGSWCRTVTITPSGRWRDLGTFWEVGTANAPDSVSFTANAGDGMYYFNMRDAAGVAVGSYASFGTLTDGSTHTVTACWDGVTRSIYLDGVARSAVAYGGALGAISATQQPVYIGCRSNGVGALNGSIKSLRLCPNETDPARCEAGTGLKVAPMFSPKRWCVRAKNVTPVGTWSTGSRIPVLGGAWAGANTYGIYTTGGSVVCSIWDMAAAQRYHSVSVPDDSATHTFVCCNNDGVPLLQVDGVTSVYARAGTGSGLMSVMPPTSGPTGTPNLTIESIDWNTSGNPLDF